jgi:alkylmercury lyase
MRPTIDEISTAFTHGFVTLTDDEQRLARAVYRLLGTGRAAPTDAIARQTGWSHDDVGERLRSWPAVFWDDDGAVVGFWGLAAEAVTGHRIDLEDIGTAWTWCSYDTLFIPGLLDVAARVDSVCSTTGEPVRLTVSASGVTDLQPADAVVSLLVPDGPFDDNVRQTLCHYILFFGSPDAAEEWIKANPGTFWLPVSEAFEVARQVNRAVFPVLVSREAAR